MSEKYILDKKEGEFTLPRISTEAIKDLKTQYDMFRQLQKEVLQENVDYGFPAGQRDPSQKPSLYKSGAEKLTRLFNLTPSFELIKIEEREDYVYYLFKCTLKTVSGIVVGEGYGSANSKEKRHWSENPLGNANTILKMAKKRAHVDAVLTGLGASNVFTQDLEDMEENGHAQEQKTHEQTQTKASEKQIKYIQTLISEISRLSETPRDQLVAEIKDKYGVASSKELTVEQASQLIGELQKQIEQIQMQLNGQA
jgi:hypothetical protein